MKNYILIVLLLSVAFVNAQAFKGKGDNKVQIGLNAQEKSTGINATYDFGVGENISFGFVTTYALGISENTDADFADRLDLRARFNANIGNVLRIDDNFDLYPGLSFGLKNFGGHIGARYFFSSGFGVYSEVGIPIAKYNTDTLTAAEKIHNQFVFNLGASFNL
ncbi:DUF6646 family protein [Paucihalobacter sp.]|uniref:DUF6646 family protein n=1 Tax=Paucihalobacter sp. TaxID=2850405 RepID=UPI002FE12B43